MVPCGGPSQHSRRPFHARPWVARGLSSAVNEPRACTRSTESHLAGCTPSVCLVNGLPGVPSWRVFPASDAERSKLKIWGVEVWPEQCDQRENR